MGNELSTIISMIVQDLRKNKYSKIIDLIKKAKPEMEYVDHDNWNGGIDYYDLVFYIEYDYYVEIADIKEKYESIMTDSLNNFYKDEQTIINNIKIRSQIKQYIDWAAISDKENKKSLINKLLEEKNILSDIATGKYKIQDINDEYMKKHAYLISTLKKICLEHVNQYNDLWDWYKDYKHRKLDTYQSRRDFLKDLYDPFIDIIKSSSETKNEITSFELTGWAKVDDAALRMKDILRNASITEDYQAVGMFARELLISLAQSVFDGKKHKVTDDIEISATDSKRMLEAYINYCVQHNGSSYAIKYAKSAVNFSNELTHKRTATSMDAELCYIAVTSTINIIKTLDKYITCENVGIKEQFV